MPLEHQNGFGAAALDQQQELDAKQGWAVVPSGGNLGTQCEVTIDTGTLGTGESTLSVASGEVLADGGTVSVSSQSVAIATGDADPRKDVIYIDSNGDAQARKGSPAAVPAKAPGNRFQTWKPAPYDMHDVDGVVLAAVWVSADATSVGSGDLRDRRVSAAVYFSSLDTERADIEDTSTDPSTNGEVRRNGSDVKVHSGGAVQSLSDIGSGGLETTTIDDTDSPYLTQDEDVIYCDTSAGAVTVQLASANATLANEIRVVNIDATNAVTVETEGSETIDPNAEASKTITNAGWAVAFVSDSSNWDTTLEGEFESLSTDDLILTDRILLKEGSNVRTFEDSVSGIREAINAMTSRSALQLPPSDYQIGTTGLGKLPARASVRGAGRRATTIRPDDGVGTVLQTDDSNVLADFSILGKSGGTADDTAIEGTAGVGNSRVTRIEIQNMWRAIYWDAYYNSVVQNCWFSNSRTGQTDPGGYVMTDTASGSNNNCRFISNFFGSNETTAAVVNSNETMWLGNHFEGNKGEYGLVFDFGRGHSVIGSTIEQGSTGVSGDVHHRANGGKGFMLGIQGKSGDSTVNMIQLSGNVDEWLAADPIRGVGWNNLITGGTSESMTQFRR